MCKLVYRWKGNLVLFQCQLNPLYFASTQNISSVVLMASIWVWENIKYIYSNFLNNVANWKAIIAKLISEWFLSHWRGTLFLPHFLWTVNHRFKFTIRVSKSNLYCQGHVWNLLLSVVLFIITRYLIMCYIKCVV